MDTEWKKRYLLRERYFFLVFRDSKGSHSFESSSSSARISSEVEPSESFAEIRNTSKLTAVNEDIQETDCDIFQPLVVLCVMWYCGYQATVWALVMIVLDLTSPYMALSKPKQVHERAPRISRLLSPGNTTRNQPLSQYSVPEDISSTTEEEIRPLSRRSQWHTFERNIMS